MSKFRWSAEETDPELFKNGQTVRMMVEDHLQHRSSQKH